MDVFVVRFGLPESSAQLEKGGGNFEGFSGAYRPVEAFKGLQLNGFSGLGVLYLRKENPCPPNVPRPSPIILLA
jgi:hypothetical protein